MPRGLDFLLGVGHLNSDLSNSRLLKWEGVVGFFPLLTSALFLPGSNGGGGPLDAPTVYA